MREDLLKGELEKIERARISKFIEKTWVDLCFLELDLTLESLAKLKVRKF